MSDYSTRHPRHQETLAILTASRAILSDDHFVYISGDHGSGWVDKDSLFVDPRHLQTLGGFLAETVRDLNAEFLCGPATGGLIVAQWTAAALHLPAVFAEHETQHGNKELRGRFELRRGYDQLIAGRRVLIVDDVVNSGHSIRQTAEAIRRADGIPIAAAALVHRGNTDAVGMHVPEFHYLLEYDIPEWPADACPLCRSGVPINTRFAHGQDFLAARGLR